jgi:hypothetical protein
VNEKLTPKDFAIAFALTVQERHHGYAWPGTEAITELIAAAEERGRLQGQFSPLGDNHHNAAACPHCGDLLTKAEERGRRSGVEDAAKVCDRAKAAGPCAEVALEFARIIAESIRALAPRDSAPRTCDSDYDYTPKPEPQCNCGTDYMSHKAWCATAKDRK